MQLHVTRHRGGFGPGLTPITTLDDETGIALSVLVLGPGEATELTARGEVALLLMRGRAALEARAEGGPSAREVARASLFDDLPWCLHAPSGTRVFISALEPTELTLWSVESEAAFAPRLIGPSDTRTELRGRGLVGDLALRRVRTILDRASAPPEAKLVLGEVVTLPGRWSSYPPHHHPQPELYHYRFTAPEGWGHAELGDLVVKVRQNDTVKILPGLDHPQAAAPGYGMYYAWAIRHLPGEPYETPELAEEHAWIAEGARPAWWPREEEDRRG